MVKKGLRRAKSARKIIFELEETIELDEPPEEQLISRVSKVEEALKALGRKDLDADTAKLLEEQKRRLLELEKESTKPVDSLRKEEVDVETEEVDEEREEDKSRRKRRKKNKE